MRGNLVYAYGALRALADWRPATFTVRVDRRRAARIVTGLTVAAANSNYYGGGMMMAPAADLHDGQLDIVIIHQHAQAALPRLLPTVFSGRHVDQPGRRGRARRPVEISASRPFTLYADGDPIGELPVTVSCYPGRRPALDRCRVPRAPRGAGHERARRQDRRRPRRRPTRAPRRRRGGTSLPGKLLTRHGPPAIERLAGRLPTARR